MPLNGWCVSSYYCRRRHRVEWRLVSILLHLRCCHSGLYLMLLEKIDSASVVAVASFEILTTMNILHYLSNHFVPEDDDYYHGNIPKL